VSVLDGPGEGTWSVFAAKVVEQRDEARAEVERLKRWNAAMGTEHRAWHKMADKVTALEAELAVWRKNAEYACENPPADCECPGCGLAREEQGRTT